MEEKCRILWKKDERGVVQNMDWLWVNWVYYWGESLLLFKDNTQNRDWFFCCLQVDLDYPEELHEKHAGVSIGINLHQWNEHLILIFFPTVPISTWKNGCNPGYAEYWSQEAVSSNPKQEILQAEKIGLTLFTSKTVHCALPIASALSQPWTSTWQNL